MSNTRYFSGEIGAKEYKKKITVDMTVEADLRTVVENALSSFNDNMLDFTPDQYKETL